MYTAKALLSPREAYLILGPKRRGLIRERGLIKSGGGGGLTPIHIISTEFTINSCPNFTITSITETEHEVRFVSRFNFTNAMSFIP